MCFLGRDHSKLRGTSGGPGGQPVHKKCLSGADHLIVVWGRRRAALSHPRTSALLHPHTQTRARRHNATYAPEFSPRDRARTRASGAVVLTRRGHGGAHSLEAREAAFQRELTRERQTKRFSATRIQNDQNRRMVWREQQRLRIPAAGTPCAP